MADLSATTAQWTARIETLKQHGRHRRKLADSTEDNLRFVQEKWKSFCSHAGLDDSDVALGSGRSEYLKAFCEWMIENAERSPQQAVSVKSYFRRLKQAYKALTGQELDRTTAEDVNAYIDDYIGGMKNTCPRPKPVPSATDLLNMLRYIYQADPSVMPDERQRVQQAFLMQVHMYSGSRPGTTTRTRHSKSRTTEGENKREGVEYSKLRYRDFTLLLTKDEQGTTRFAVRPLFSRFKGENRRAQRKKFTWFDKPDVLTCPVAHLVALALHDGAFKAPLTTAKEFFSLTLPEGTEQLLVHWNDACIDRPVFREPRPGLLDRELSANTALKRLQKMGECMGFRDNLTWYCFRRSVLNAIDGCGSDEIRNQVAGHLESRTYRAHYQNYNVGLDVSSLVIGQPTEDKLISRLNYMGVDADPRANVQLTEEDHIVIANLPDVIALQSEYDDAVQQCKPTDVDGIGEHKLQAQHERLAIQKKLRARREYHRRMRVKELRRAYFQQKDDALIAAQLRGETIKPAAEKQCTLSLPERQHLASLPNDIDMRSTEMIQSRIAAVQAMTDLCGRVEVRENPRIKYTMSPLADKMEVVHETLAEFPLQCHELQCLFCIGDKTKSVRHRRKKFNRIQALWRHAQSHLAALDISGIIYCPHPLCVSDRLAFVKMAHFLNHSQTKHGVRLRPH